MNKDLAEDRLFGERLRLENQRLASTFPNSQFTFAASDMREIGVAFDGRRLLQLEHFKINRVVGQGAMGFVCEGEDIDLGRKVAIKFLLSSDRVGATKLRDQVIAEARIAASIHHPNIVGVYHVSRQGETPFIAMEYVEGLSLRHILDANQQGFRLRDTYSVMSGVLNGLAAAHAAGVVHRDIKPANIIIMEYGDAKIADFGLASIAGATEAGIGGTLAYMAPEQWSGLAFSSSDIHALGVMFSELLLGHHPFRGLRPQTLEEHDKIAMCANSLPRRTPPEWRQMIARCLASEPAARPSAQHLIGRLRRIYRHHLHLAGGVLMGGALVLSGLNHERNAAHSLDPFCVMTDQSAPAITMVLTLLFVIGLFIWRGSRVAGILGTAWTLDWLWLRADHLVPGGYIYSGTPLNIIFGTWTLISYGACCFATLASWRRAGMARPLRGPPGVSRVSSRLHRARPVFFGLCCVLLGAIVLWTGAFRTHDQRRSRATSDGGILEHKSYGLRLAIASGWAVMNDEQILQLEGTEKVEIVKALPTLRKDIIAGRLGKSFTVFCVAKRNMRGLAGLFQMKTTWVGDLPYSERKCLAVEGYELAAQTFGKDRIGGLQEGIAIGRAGTLGYQYDVFLADGTKSRQAFCVIDDLLIAFTLSARLPEDVEACYQMFREMDLGPKNGPSRLRQTIQRN